MENRDSKVLLSRGVRSLNKPSRYHSNKKQSPLGRTIQLRQSITLKAVEQSIKKSKSSGKCVMDSPYLEHTFRSRLVKLLKPSRSSIISNEIQVKQTIRDRDKSTDVQQEGAIRVEVKFKGMKIKSKIIASNTTQFFELLKKEIIKVCNDHGGNYTRQAIKIIGFQTLENNREMDYALTLNTTFQLKQLHLKPLIYHRSKSISLKDFKIIKSLGSGGFSQVYLVRSKIDGEFYALKLMQKEFIMQNERDLIVENERYILQVTDSPFLIKLYHAFETEKYFAFVIQYCSGGQLFYRLKEIKRMTEDEAKFYFLQILFGIKYLHEKGILYRDLKPENLLIGSDGHMKIADFGLAKPNVKTRQQSYSFCGSPEYMAPQMLCKSGHSFTLDYYCLGALLYELVTGLPPYYSKDHDQIYDSILNEELVIPDHFDLSPELRNFLKGLLHKDPKMRLGGYSGIKQILIHPWLGKINAQDIIRKKFVPPYIPNKYLFNFDKTSQEQANSLSLVLKQQQNQQSFKTYFSDSFQYSMLPSDKQLTVLQELKNYDKRQMQRQNVQQISKRLKWKDDSKWTHRTPLKLKSMNSQTFSSRLKA